MIRTTIDIDPAILRELNARKRREGKTLGRLVSELLADALQGERLDGGAPQVHWSSAPMRARLDLEDAEALRRALDER